MIKTAAIAAALVIGLATAGYAQTSSPAGESSAQKSGNMGSSGSSATRPTGTTGMSSGSGSARTSAGGANGSPDMAPHTTTGPQGPASESESPAK